MTSDTESGTSPAWRGEDLAITPAQFLQALTEGIVGPDEHVITGRKLKPKFDAAGRELTTGFAASRWPETSPASKHHASIALQAQTTDGFADGGQTSKLANWRGMWALVLDDVYEKVDPALIRVQPSVIIETKPGSEQWWYVFDAPVRNGFLAEQLVAGACTAGLSDPGMSNVVRWARLPGSQPPGKKFAARVTLWQPDRLFEPVQLARDLGIEMRSWDHWNGETGFGLQDLGEEIEDPALEWLAGQAMVRGRSGQGWLKVECPRGHEHSNDSDEAYYLPLHEHGGGLFKCFHGHDGNPPSQAEFKAHLQLAGMPEAVAGSLGGAVKPRDMGELAQIMGLVRQAAALIEEHDVAGMTALERRQLRKQREEQAQPGAGVAAARVMPAAFADMVLTKDTLGHDGSSIALVGDSPLDYAFNRQTGLYMHMTKPVDMQPKAFNTDMITRHGAGSFTAGAGDKEGAVPPDLYHAFNGGQVVDAVEYNPRAGTTYTDPLNGLVKLNSFHRLPMPALVPDQGGRCRILRDLYHDAMGPEMGALLLQFAGHLIQRPGVKVKWVPLMVGEGGIGKSFMAAVPAAALGAHAETVDIDVLYSDNHARLTGKVLVVFDEIYHIDKGGMTDRATVTERMKRFIVSPYVDVADKYVRKHTVLNVTNYWGSTNHHNALHLGDSGSVRRWAVIDVVATVTDWEPYWELLQEPGVVRSWLQSVDIASFNPDAWAPSSAAKDTMIATSASGGSSVLRDALEMGGSGIYADAGIVALPRLLSVAQGICQDQKEQPMRNAALKGELGRMGWRLVSDDDRPQVALIGEARGRVRVAYDPSKFERGVTGKDIAARFVELVREERELGEKMAEKVVQMKPKKP